MLSRIAESLFWIGRYIERSDGTARIPYRGSQWTVVLRPGSLPSTGLYRVIEVQGNRLIVDKA